MRRSDQRRDAVFALYQHEVTGRPLDELLEDSKPFSVELAKAVEEHRPELDELAPDRCRERHRPEIRTKRVARAGVEPATFHFSGERCYQLSYLAKNVGGISLA